MPGSATLGSNLVDDLVETVDELREDLYTNLGTRQFRVYAVKRTWSGAERGAGTYVIDSEIEITPLPAVNDGTSWDAMEHGKDEQGILRLSEISLTYTSDELTGGTLSDREEFYYRIVDIRGQEMGTDYYVPIEEPAADREQSIGWQIKLRRAQIKEGAPEGPGEPFPEYGP